MIVSDSGDIAHFVLNPTSLYINKYLKTQTILYILNKEIDAVENLLTRITLHMLMFSLVKHDRLCKACIFLSYPAEFPTHKMKEINL